jgi:hypothetical protein
MIFSRATGATTAMVERMEESFKKDVLREVRTNEGRVLLHDEVEDRPGSFAIVPLWQSVSEADILTPRDVFTLMKKEGFKVSFVSFMMKGYNLKPDRLTMVGSQL